MLTCQEITELVTDYLDGRMSLYDRVRFRMHITMCKHCRTFIDQMRQTIDVLGEVPEQVEIPDDVRSGLAGAFADWKTTAQSKPD